MGISNAKSSFAGNFGVDFPTRVEWTDDVLHGYGTVFFNDESIMVYGADAGFFSDKHNVAESYGLPVFVNVFQAEVLGIVEAYR